MADVEEGIAVEIDELQERIAAFPRWYYRFEFDNGVSTPFVDPGLVNRHEQRYRYFFEPLISLAGGSLAGRRVLDLGCNSGFWSLKAIEAGAEFVLGIDAEQLNLDQAELVFEAKDVERSRYGFQQGNVLKQGVDGRFDVVLCLGLFEHVAKPFELFELIAGTGAEIVVIDTEISRARASLFEVDSLYDDHGVVDSRMVLVPSRAALIDLARQFGYEAVALAPNFGDLTGLKDYEHQRRLAFICSKSLALDALPRETHPPRVPWWLAALNPRRR